MSDVQINSLFYFIASFTVLINCFHLFRQKLVRGVSVFSTGFMVIWGMYSVYFYGSISALQYTFYGSVLLMFVNALWASMMVYYVWKEKTYKRPANVYQVRGL
jgi:hypothetical protein